MLLKNQITLQLCTGLREKTKKNNPVKKTLCFIFLFFTLTHTAFSVTEEPQASNWDWDWKDVSIQNYRFVIIPTLGATVAAASLGISAPVIIGGTLAGAIDELLIHTGYCESHHLIMGLWGTGIASTLKSSYYLAKTAGFAFGISLSLGTFDTFKEDPTHVIENMKNGAIYLGGPPGLTSGIAVEVIDKSLIAYNYTQTEYFSELLSTVAHTKVLFVVVTAPKLLPYVGDFYAQHVSEKIPKRYTTEIVGVLWAAMTWMKSSETDPIKNVPDPSLFEIVEDLDSILPSTIDEEPLDLSDENTLFLILIGNQIVWAKLFESLVENAQNSYSIARTNPMMSEEFRTSLHPVGISLSLLIVFDYAIKMAKQHYQDTLQQKIQSSFEKKYLPDNASLQLELEDNPDIQLFSEKMELIFELRLNLMTNFIDAYIQGLCYTVLLARYDALGTVIVTDAYFQFMRDTTGQKKDTDILRKKFQLLELTFKGIKDDIQGDIVRSFKDDHSAKALFKDTPQKIIDQGKKIQQTVETEVKNYLQYFKILPDVMLQLAYIKASAPDIKAAQHLAMPWAAYKVTFLGSWTQDHREEMLLLQEMIQNLNQRLEQSNISSADGEHDPNN